MLSLLPLDVITYLLLFLPRYAVVIFRYVDKRLYQKLTFLIAQKHLLVCNNSQFYTEVIKQRSTHSLSLIEWARNTRTFEWPRSIYDTAEKYERWDVLNILREEKRLNPNLVKEVSLCIKSKYRERYLYDHDTCKWWQYSLHRWYPISTSPLKTLSNEVREYYERNTTSTKEWNKLLTLFRTPRFIDAVAKDAEQVMQRPTLPGTSGRLVCCANGLVDMSNMTLRGGRTEDNMFQGSETEYVPESITQPLPSAFNDTTGRVFLSFCRNAFLGIASNAFFVIQATDYVAIITYLRNVMGDYAEFYNPAKGPYILKHILPKMTVIECECPITAGSLKSLLSCGAFNVVLVCKKASMLDPQIFTGCTIYLELDNIKEIDEQLLLAHILHAPDFLFDNEVIERCKKRANEMDIYNRFIATKLSAKEGAFLNPSDISTECKAWILRSYPHISVPHTATVKRKLEERLGSWRGYELKR